MYSLKTLTGKFPFRIRFRIRFRHAFAVLAAISVLAALACQGADGEPGPDEPMKQRYECPANALMPGTDVAVPPAAQTFMNLPELWESAGRGAGVTVAVIDTGVWPSPRLPHLRGGGLPRLPRARRV